MADARKPARLVELEDIISSNILGDDPDVIALVIKAHLALEAILIELTGKLGPDDKRRSFPDRTKLLESRGLISQSDRVAFDRFNDFRNDFAHIFGHRVSIADVLAMARDLERAGVDFSDSVGHYSPQQASEYYGGMVGILAEVGWCILFHAGFLLSEAGGRSIFN